jgi:hypothetical protein
VIVAAGSVLSTGSPCFHAEMKGDELDVKPITLEEAVYWIFAVMNPFDTPEPASSLTFALES